MAHDPLALDDAFLAFWRERHISTLTTRRPDGSPHVVPVGVTYQAEAGIARVISSRTSRKVRNVLAAGSEGMRVAVCQVEGARWSTLEGVAVVRDAPGAVADAVRRYTERYREPRVNPDRVVIEITVDRVLGRA
ncbi:TIGR03618 family F420-dependent PPOX class oxidoreductase [Kitasatospora sp. NPDC058170]|uniref:TIGR03618 family F420-dependent PPOX class oxidoreductase n=1 Tax=Kitasatospora sp. NPDC058170 TaxID=3346364 RepID=UPI0036DE4148